MSGSGGKKRLLSNKPSLMDDSFEKCPENEEKYRQSWLPASSKLSLEAPSVAPSFQDVYGKRRKSSKSPIQPQQKHTTEDSKNTKIKIGNILLRVLVFGLFN